MARTERGLTGDAASIANEVIGRGAPVLFVVVLVMSNILSSAKIVDWGVSLGGIPLAFDAGTLLFPVSYIFGDILTEVYGFKRSRRVIWMGFFGLAVCSLLLYGVRILPGEALWEQSVGQRAFDAVFGGMISGGIVVANPIPVEDEIPEAEIGRLIEQAVAEADQRGITGAAIKEEDFITTVFVAETHDTLLLFTSQGRVFKKDAYEIPEAPRTSFGKPIVNLLELREGESVVALLPIRSFDTGEDVFFATENGIVKRTALADFRNVNRKGIIAIKFKDMPGDADDEAADAGTVDTDADTQDESDEQTASDRLIQVRLVNENDHILLVTATPHSGDEQAPLLGLLRPDFLNLPQDLSGREHEKARREVASHLVQRRRADIRSYLAADTTFPQRENRAIRH